MTVKKNVPAENKPYDLFLGNASEFWNKAKHAFYEFYCYLLWLRRKFRINLFTRGMGWHYVIFSTIFVIVKSLLLLSVLT